MAARALFVGKGYDEATMRDIARLADVGLGTLFLYAADKRDLLFLAYDDEHEQIVKAVTNFRPTHASLLEDLTAYFRALYDIFAAEPEFTRVYPARGYVLQRGPAGYTCHRYPAGDHQGTPEIGGRR